MKPYSCFYFSVLLVTIVGIKVQERGKMFCFKYVHERFSIPVKVGKSKGMG